jgi:3-oxoacyl-[acyl-carrier protein] reductase
MKQRLAVITGGTRGLGLAIAARLGRGGMKPVMLYRSDEQAAQQALATVSSFAPDAEIAKVDISDGDQVDALITRLGTVDVLVNNAFSPTGAPAKTHELPLETWDRSLAANLSGPFRITRAVLPKMIDQSFGRIVFIGSLAARGESGRAAYAVAKNGQIGLMYTIAAEYARLGITANMVSPGYMDAGAFLRLDESIRERAAKSVPMNRLGHADEIAEAVWYFVGPESGYTTGQILGVHGGAR